MEESPAVNQVTSQEKSSSVILPLFNEGCEVDPSKVKCERVSPEHEPHVYVDVIEMQLPHGNDFSRDCNIQNENPGNVSSEVSGYVSVCQLGGDGNTADTFGVNCCYVPFSQYEQFKEDLDEIRVDGVNNSREISEKQQNPVSYSTQTDSEIQHQSEENETSFSNFILTSCDTEINDTKKYSEILDTLGNEQTNGSRGAEDFNNNASSVDISSFNCEQLPSKCDIPGKLYKCDDCGTVVNCFSNLKTHLKSHIQINDSVIYSVIHNIETSKHKAGCRRKRSYKCDACNVDLSSLSRIRSHLVTHVPGKLYECDDCGQRDTSFSRLKQHIGRHLKMIAEICYICAVCSLNFSSRRGLFRHQRKHTHDKTHLTTTYCVDYSSNDLISKHKPAHIVDETHVCDFCRAIFTYRNNLLRHRKLHTKPKSFICDLCGLGFSSNYNMIEHRSRHTGEKPHACHVCSKSFTCKGNLVKHRKVHIKEKPFLCDVCGAAFKWLSHLKEHKRIHTGDKPYKCDFCNKLFAAHGHLKKHRVIHTGERNYKCHTCGKTFSRQTNLRSHERIHKRNQQK